jgi:hypothetical protein
MRATPPTDRGPDWRDAGLCRSPEYRGQADLWFATSHDKLDRELAQQACRRCPSLGACAIWAVLSGIEYGTWGALHEEERAALRKRLGPEHRNDPAAVARAVHQALNPAAGQPRTLHTIWEHRTHPLPDGHLGWRGKPAVDYGGRPYTKKQVAFYVSRGRMPVGIVRRTCEVEECVSPLHMADNEERAHRAAAREKAAV